MAMPRDPGGRPRPRLQRHASFPVPKPEVGRSAPPRRPPLVGPPAPKRKPRPTGVFAQPITPPTTRLRQAQRQAATRTRRAAARAPQPAPTIPVIAPRNQPRNYQQNVRRLAAPIVQAVHDRAMADARRGGSYRQSVSAQLDALGPQARRLFRTYLQTVAAPNAQRLMTAQRREAQRRVAMGFTPTSQLQARAPGRHGAAALLGDIGSYSFGLLPRFLAGPVATRVQQSGGGNLAGVLRLAREPEEIARTYAEHPSTVSRDLAYWRDFLLGTAAIPYNLIRDPKGGVRSLVRLAKQAPQALIQDEIRRHKYAFQGNYGAFRGIVRQTGASPYALDYASLLGVGGKTAGALAKSGALGRRLEEYATAPRARLRLAGGETRLQRDETRKVAPNLLRLHMQRRRDVRREQAHVRREARAQKQAGEYNVAYGEGAPGTRRFVQPQTTELRAAAEQRITQAGGKVHRDEQGRIQSVRFTAERAAAGHPSHFERVRRGLEELGFERRRVGGNLVFYAPKEVTRRSVFLENRAIRSIPAHLKGVSVQEIRGVSAEEAHAFNQAAGPSARLLRVRGLSRQERAALLLSGTGRIATNPRAARAHLMRIRRRILRDTSGQGEGTDFRGAAIWHGPDGDHPVTVTGHAGRHDERDYMTIEGSQTSVPLDELAPEHGIAPRRTPFETDTLKRIDYLIQHADKAFTPRMREALDKIRAQVRRGERENPFLVPRQVIGARYGPAAAELGVKRPPGRGRIHGAHEGGVRWEPTASAKSIARQEEKLARTERGGRVRGARHLNDENQALAAENGPLLERSNARSQEIDRLARERDQAYRAGDKARADELHARIVPLVDANERDWIRSHEIGRRQEAIYGELQRLRGEGRISGRPEVEASRVTWYHGTAMRYSGPPTAEGKWSDLGVYLTSDPGYAKGYALSGGEMTKDARIMRTRVQPKQTLEARFGRIDPATIAEIARRLLKRADEATVTQRARMGAAHDQLLPHRAGQLNALRPMQRKILVDIQRAMSDHKSPLRRAASGEVKLTGEAHMDALRQWQELDQELRSASESIAAAEGKAPGSGGIGHKPLKEILRSMGYDSIRKVDVNADALVVLDERLLGRRPRSDEMRSWLLNGAKKDPGETTAQWAKRVRRVMEENGIDHPPFFAPSEELRTPKYSIYTAGGARSPEPFKKRTYVLQRKGRERTDPEVIYEGIQRNHRMRISAQLVVDVANRVAHHRYQNMKTHDLKLLAQKEGFDPSQYAVWYPKLYRDTLRGRLVGELEGEAAGAGRSAADLERGAFEAEGGMGHLHTLLDPNSRDSAIVAADNIHDLQRQLDAPRFKAERGTLIPRAAADELLASTKETAFGRAMERLKTLQSRAVLGGLNVNWVQADTVVNSLVATVLGGASPTAFVMQHGFFRRLPPDLKHWVHDELDIGTSRSNTHIPRFGATVNNRFANFFRFWRNSPWGQRVRPIQRTVSTFLTLERKVGNNPQRRALAYHLLRKEAFRQLDADVGYMNGVMARVQSIFTAGTYTPQKVRHQMIEIMRNKRQFEEIGRRTADILGDWTTFTALERKTLGRYFFFYPYLRYATKLAFYTLPLDHPIRLALIANLANLNMDEQRRLIGATDDDTYLLAGRYFYRDSKGQMHEYNVRTFNPVGTTVTEASSSADLLQLLPPVFTIGLGQIMKRDIYRGRDWRVKGSASSTAASDIGPLDGLLGSTRWRVLAKGILDLPPLTREIAKYMLPGEQGDDSLPFAPRPTVFKDPQRQAQAEAKRKRETMSLAQRFLQDQFRAFVPRDSDILDVLQRRHAHLPGGTGAGATPRGSGWGSKSTTKSTGSSTGWGTGGSGSTSGWGG